MDPRAYLLYPETIFLANDFLRCTVVSPCFYKYSVAGNDFFVCDNRLGIWNDKGKDFWAVLCARRTGVGADGVLLLESDPSADFRMRYLNSDGGEVEMCGNGARAISHFASLLEIAPKNPPYYTFTTTRSTYRSMVEGTSVQVEMTELLDIGAIDVSDWVEENLFLDGWYLNTGVPHVVFIVEDVKDVEIAEIAPAMRYDSRFIAAANINFAQVTGDKILLRTYERGVEGETLACGTGATAAAVMVSRLLDLEGEFEVVMPGGSLWITVKNNERWLKGLVQIIYRGELCLK